MKVSSTFSLTVQTDFFKLFPLGLYKFHSSCSGETSLDDSLESNCSKNAVTAISFMPGQSTTTAENECNLHEFKIPDTSPCNLPNVLSSTYSYDRESELSPFSQKFYSAQIYFLCRTAFSVF